MDKEELKVCCNCQAKVLASNYEIHVAHCQRNRIVCEKCSEPVFRCEMERHLATEHAPVSCKKCGKQFEMWKSRDHADECIKRPIPCIYCEQECPWDAIKDHESYCGSRTEQCAYCKKRVMKKDFDDHLEECQRHFSFPNDIVTCPNCSLQMESSVGKLHIPLCLKATKTKDIVTCPNCSLQMESSVGKLHISLCLKATKTKTFEKGTDAEIERNLWNSSQANKKEDIKSDSVTSIVESMSKLSTSESSPVSPENYVSKYAPQVPILSEGRLKLGRKNKNEINNRAFSERKMDSSAVTQAEKEEEDEDIVSQLQRLRLPMTVDDASPVISHKETTLPKQILSQSAVASCNSGSQEAGIHQSRTIAASPRATIHRASATARPGCKPEEDILYMLTVTCPICSKSFSVKEIEHHVSACGTELSVNCPICKSVVAACDKDSHINDCLLHMKESDEAKMMDTQSCKKKKKKDKKDKHKDNMGTATRYDGHHFNAEWQAKIPCEFCGKQYPFGQIIEHQSGCRPDLLHSFPGTESSDNNPDVIPGNDDLPNQPDAENIDSSYNFRAKTIDSSNQLRTRSENRPYQANTKSEDSRTQLRARNVVSSIHSRAKSEGSPIQLRANSEDSPHQLNARNENSPIHQSIRGEDSPNQRTENEEYAAESGIPGSQGNTSELKHPDNDTSVTLSRDTDNSNYSSQSNPDQSAQCTSVSLYQQKANQNLWRDGDYQNSQSSFQWRSGKRRGVNYQRSIQFENAIPGEFLPSLQYVGFPDCYQIYQKVPIPPPYPPLYVFAAQDQSHTRLSYADVAKSSYEKDYYYHEDRKRWKKGSGMYESLSSESDEFLSPVEDQSDQSSVYASCQSDFEASDHRQGHWKKDSSDSESEENKKEKTIALKPTKNFAPKRSRKERKTSKGRRR